ncbi:glycosyltransferase family 2 protein [Synechococcus sp. CS-1328]|uniref:glycosyltransferase family 2 protein n=1 Tax=Synechococcus sp. CS-1328 TaxID=2847976 RepID=UPI00223AB969|nr:glycosyltransferase family 2 protein [Synechococcus sp. CS-1328]MCT0223680.1 glycosyltransferase family 2 protein [Synechococcus sp. CS-1328]
MALLKVKNEWPLAAVAIVHALLHHADELIVLDHGSSDGTPAGLARLKTTELGPRLHLYTLSDAAFQEEAFTNVLVEIAQSFTADWIYPLDADEFLHAPAGLRALLGAIPSTIHSLHYTVENWLVPPDFDEADLSHYGRIHSRSLPDQPTGVCDSRSVDGILQGQLNYFCFPFGSKVLLRPGRGLWLTAGAHEVLPRRPQAMLRLHRDHLRCQHIPFTGLAKLRRKSAWGRRHIADGMPPWYSWQNQMLNRVESLGLLEQFWQRHSHAGAPPASLPGQRLMAPNDGLRVTVDSTLQQALQPTLSWLERTDLFSARGHAPALPAASASSPPLATPLPASLYGLALRATAALQDARGSGYSRHLQGPSSHQP